LKKEAKLEALKADKESEKSVHESEELLKKRST